MLRIRLTRVGKKKRPAYRIVVADSRAPRDGAFVEIIGHYDPLPDPARITINEERALDWLKAGAQPSDTAAKLLHKVGVLEKAGLKPILHAPAPAAAAAPAPAKARARVRAKAKAAAPSPEAEKAATEEDATQEAKEQQPEQENPPAETAQEPSPGTTE